MKFIMEKSNLIENLSKVSRSITGKSSTVALNGVFIQVDDNQIIMLGSDMELSIFARSNCEVIEPGEILVDAKIFLEIIRKLPNDSVIIETSEDNFIKISCQKAEFEILKMNEKEYPNLPKENKGTEIVLSKNMFSKMIGEVYFAAAHDNSRPILQGILYEIKESVLNLVALDGYRVAYTSTKVNSTSDIRAVIDSKSLTNISKILGTSDGDIQIYMHNNQAEFRVDNLIIYSRLLEGEYIKYESLLPENARLSFIIDRLELIGAIERGALIAQANDNYNPVLEFKILANGMLDVLEVSSKSIKGKAREELPIEILGEDKDLEIAFNGRYLLDMLKSMDADKIIMKFNNSVSPSICHPHNSEDNKYLILPVRLSK